jgi:hypothetical protein
MRQGRTVFPAMVLKQHEDDGSLDAIVFFEAEDIIWEQRIMPMTEARIGNCWEPVVSKVEMVEGADDRHVQPVDLLKFIEELGLNRRDAKTDVRRVRGAE